MENKQQKNGEEWNIFDQIEADKKDVSEWPDWMQSIAYFSAIPLIDWD